VGLVLILPAALIVVPVAHRGALLTTGEPAAADSRYVPSGTPASGSTTARSAGGQQGERRQAAGLSSSSGSTSCPTSPGFFGSGDAHRPAATSSASLRAGLVRFRVYDTAGRRLGWPAFRSLQENGKGEDGDNDMILDPATLRVRSGWPLYEDAGDPVLDRPSGAAALSMAWPTTDGYSALILDLPRPGTYVFNLLAAQQAVAQLRTALSDRPDYRPSPAFRVSWRTARSDLALAGAARTDADRGRFGARAYEAAVHAQLLLLREFGMHQLAQPEPPAPTLGPSIRPAGNRPRIGFTFDAIRPGAGDLERVSALVHDRRGAAAVRLVFDLSQGPSYYAATVRAAHRAGILVVGQILDSSDMARVSQQQWRLHVTRFVSGLPDVDTWEVGNEVNGNWLGSGVATKIGYAAAYVKAHTRASTLLTLYWQLGEDDPQHSVFSWASSLPRSTVRNLDQIGLSVYPEDHPLGAAFDRVFRTMHEAFPRQRLLITELGYWSADLGHTWWWGSRHDPIGKGRRAVADLYTRAVFGYPYSAGGTYWWYFLEEVRRSDSVFRTFAHIGDAVSRSC
jgi:hypothetical protein